LKPCLKDVLDQQALRTPSEFSSDEMRDESCAHNALERLFLAGDALQIEGMPVVAEAV
jgi:hypothetical protein